MDKQAAYDIAKDLVINWSVDKDGYRCATVTKNGDSRTVRRHILNFYLEYGWIPDYVDHKDNIPGNDDPSNLRAATASQNSCNSKRRSDNTSGVKGVSWDSSRKKWRVRIELNGKTKLIGRFNDIHEAELAIREARNEVHGEFARM